MRARSLSGIDSQTPIDIVVASIWPAASAWARTLGWPMRDEVELVGIDALAREHLVAEAVVEAADPADAEAPPGEVGERRDVRLAGDQEGQRLVGRDHRLQLHLVAGDELQRGVDGDVGHLALAGLQGGDGGGRLLHAHQLDVDALALEVAERAARDP